VCDGGTLKRIYLEIVTGQQTHRSGEQVKKRGSRQRTLFPFSLAFVLAMKTRICAVDFAEWFL